MSMYKWLTVVMVFLYLYSGKQVLGAELELYGTIHSMGVIATLEDWEDPEKNARAFLEYRQKGNGYQQGFPLTRVGHRFITSIFWLVPGKQYDVRVTFEDQDSSLLNGVRLQATAPTRPEVMVPEPTRSYVVSPSGTGRLCTSASPCGLETAVTMVRAGERVLLLDGVYYTGNMTLARTGTPAGPIMLQGYPGETAILDGSDSSSFTWSALGDGLYSTRLSTEDTHMVLANGKRLFPYDNLADLRALSQDNTPGFYCNDGILYVHLPNDTNPESATMVISSQNHAFRITGDHIYLENLTFRYYGQGSYAKAIYLDGASHTVIRSCIFASNDLGIGLKRDAHSNVIEQSEFFDTIFNWPWDGVKEAGRLEDGGIRFYSPVNGRGNIIRRNVFHDDFDGFGVCPGETEAVTNETDVYENTVYNMGDDGVEADGTCSNVRIWGNIFYDVLMGISLAPVYKGPLYAIRNVVHRTGVGNNNYTGSPFKFNSGYDKSGTLYLFHNTGDAWYPGNNGLYIKAPGSWQNIHARNNIWSGTNYGINNYNTGQPVDLDWDNVVNTGQNDLFRWNNIRYATLDSFTSATGQEAHGKSVDPLFVDPFGGDYRLRRNSPLIDAGLVIPGINSQYSGRAPDIGAYEGASLLQPVGPHVKGRAVCPANFLLLR